MIIQFILIFAVGIIGLFTLRNRERMQTKAVIKLASVLFFIFGVITVLNPELLNKLANSIGVGRGADLLLYTLFITYVFSMLYLYLEIKKNDNVKTKLARKIALLEKQLNDSRSRK